MVGWWFKITHRRSKMNKHEGFCQQRRVHIPSKSDDSRRSDKDNPGRLGSGSGAGASGNPNAPVPMHPLTIAPFVRIQDVHEILSVRKRSGLPKRSASIAVMVPLTDSGAEKTNPSPPRQVAIRFAFQVSPRVDLPGHDPNVRLVSQTAIRIHFPINLCLLFS